MYPDLCSSSVLARWVRHHCHSSGYDQDQSFEWVDHPPDTLQWWLPPMSLLLLLRLMRLTSDCSMTKSISGLLPSSQCVIMSWLMQVCDFNDLERQRAKSMLSIQLWRRQNSCNWELTSTNIDKHIIPSPQRLALSKLTRGLEIFTFSHWQTSTNAAMQSFVISIFSSCMP